MAAMSVSPVVSRPFCFSKSPQTAQLLCTLTSHHTKKTEEVGSVGLSPESSVTVTTAAGLIN